MYVVHRASFHTIIFAYLCTYMEHRKLKTAELGRMKADEFVEAEKTPIVIVLDNVRSANNVGSVFRTSDAYRIERIYLCGITACPPNKDIHKTALGAEDTVAWQYAAQTEDAVAELRSAGYRIFSVEQAENSTDLRDFSLEAGARYAFVFGNEVKGVSQNVIGMSDGVIELPQYGTKHSLNISVTAGIVIWDIFIKTQSL